MRRVRAGIVTVMALAVLGCDAWLVEPGTEEGGAMSFSIAAASEYDFGDLRPVLEKVEIADFEITSDAGTRDTTLAVRRDEATLRTRLQLRPEEAFGWVELKARLIGEGVSLFETDILEYAYTVTGERSVEVMPIVGSILSGPAWPQLTAIGDTFVVSSQTLFATGDTLQGVDVTWVSDTPGVAEVVDGQRVVARSNGRAIVVGRALGAEVTRFLTVAQRPEVMIGIAPSDTTVAVGESFFIRPFGEDANGHPLLPGTELTWIGTGGVTVTSFGRVVATTPGAATVEASFGGVTWVVTIAVTP